MEAIQKATFSRWIQSVLDEAAIDHAMGESFKESLTDGILLADILGFLQTVPVEGINEEPLSSNDDRMNLDVILTFLEEHEIDLDDHGDELTADKIVSDDEAEAETLRQLVWAIIQHYEIHHYHLKHSKTGASAEQVILQWCREKLPREDIGDLNRSWHDGQLLCSLLQVFTPDKGPETDTPLARAQWALDCASRRFAVPPVLSAKDMTNKHCPEQCLMTYLALLRNRLEMNSKLQRPSMPAAAAAYRVDDYVEEETAGEEDYEAVKNEFEGDYGATATMQRPVGDNRAVYGRGQAPRRSSALYRASQHQSPRSQPQPQGRAVARRGPSGRRVFPWNQPAGNNERGLMLARPGDVLPDGRVVTRKETRQFIEYEVDLEGWENGIWNTPKNGPPSVRYFAANVRGSTALAQRLRLAGPVWLAIARDSLAVLTQKDAQPILSAPLNHVYRYGKDIDVFSVQIGDISARYRGVLYFKTNRADDAFETMHKYSVMWSSAPPPRR